MRYAIPLAAAAALALLAPQAASAQAAAGDARPVQVAQAEGPQAVVQDFQAMLIQAMKTDGFQARVDLLRQPVTDNFHLDVMARTAAGRYWRDATPQQRDALVEAFGSMTTANYAARFNNFNGQEFSVLGTDEGPRGTQIVRTQIKPHGKDPTPLSYVVGQRDGQWGIVDVIVGGGVSELATKRSEYAAILERQGMDGLIETLRVKARELTDT